MSDDYLHSNSPLSPNYDKDNSPLDEKSSNENLIRSEDTFNLSDNIMYQMGDEELDDERTVILTTKVKEFIKRVKAIVNKGHYNWSITKTFKEIDKLAGDTLT